MISVLTHIIIIPSILFIFLFFIFLAIWTIPGCELTLLCNCLVHYWRAEIVWLNESLCQCQQELLGGGRTLTNPFFFAGKELLNKALEDPLASCWCLGELTCLMLATMVCILLKCCWYKWAKETLSSYVEVLAIFGLKSRDMEQWHFMLWSLMMSLHDLLSWKTFQSSRSSGAGYIPKCQLCFTLAYILGKSLLFLFQLGSHWKCNRKTPKLLLYSW